MKKKKKKMSGGMKAVIVILLVVAVGLLGFSAYKLIGISNTYKEANDLYDDIAALVSAPTEAADKKTVTESKTESVTEPVSEKESESEKETEAEDPSTTAADPAIQTETETEPAVEAESVSETTSEPESETEPQTRTITVSMPESVTVPAREKKKAAQEQEEPVSEEITAEPETETEPEAVAHEEMPSESEPESESVEIVSEKSQEETAPVDASEETETESIEITPDETPIEPEPEAEPAKENEQIPISGHNARILWDESGIQPLQIEGGDPTVDPREDVHYQTMEERGDVRTAFNHFRFASMNWNYDVLYEVCEDSVGWIYEDDTPISYPLVQAEDNNKYLRHMINGEYNVAGTLFVDSRFEEGLNGRYSSIYGHNMDDKSMFGSITAYKDEEYYKEHPEFEVYVGDKMYIYDVYAGFQIHIDNFMFQFFDEPGKTEKEEKERAEDFDKLLAEIEKNRTYETVAPKLGTDSHILMLVTCIDYPRDYNYRYVVILERGEQLLPLSLKEVINPHLAETK